MSYFKGQDAERMGLRPSEKRVSFWYLEKNLGLLWHYFSLFGTRSRWEKQFKIFRQLSANWGRI